MGIVCETPKKLLADEQTKDLIPSIAISKVPFY
jgi:hypothetical protein